MQTTTFNKLAKIGLSLFGCFLINIVSAAEPMWTLAPAPGNATTQTVNEASSVTLQYIVQNQSNKFKKLVILPISGITQTDPCILAPKGKQNSSCNLNLNINGTTLPKEGVHSGPYLCQANPDGTPNPNQCYQPSSPYGLNITRGSASLVQISVTPTTLQFAQGSGGSITISNLSSTEAANNIIVTAPGGSNLSISTNCPQSLPIGGACIASINGNTVEGPTTVSIVGTNTNTQTVAVTVTGAGQTQISITGPSQDNQIVDASTGTQLSLIITNNGSNPALGVTVTDKSACPNLVVDSSNCNTIAPSSSCTLLLSSSSPYIPCSILIGGTNTSSTQQGTIAFSYQGGLVFEENAGIGKVLYQGETQNAWTNPTSDVTGATSTTNGVSNTTAISNSTGCTSNTNACSAYYCNNLTPSGWYLPATQELVDAAGILCPNSSYPCLFGGFTPNPYWTSTQLSATNAQALSMVTGMLSNLSKTYPAYVRCIRSF